MDMTVDTYSDLGFAYLVVDTNIQNTIKGLKQMYTWYQFGKPNFSSSDQKLHLMIVSKNE